MSGKSRVFYTSLGHVDDFKNPQFVRLLGNAVLWTLYKPITIRNETATSARR
jgi:type 1 glutamine amidotransferase